MTTKYWIASGIATSDDNMWWSLSSGGPNNTTAPTASDDVIFDANGLGDCDWDSLEVGSITVTAGYTGLIVQFLGCVVYGNVSLSNGTFTASVMTLDVRGSWTQVTPAKFIQNNHASSKLRVGTGFSNTSTTTGNAFDSTDIIFGNGQSGITFDMQNTDFKSRMDVTMTPGNTYRMIGRCYFDAVKEAGGEYTITDNGSQQQITDCNYPAMDEIVWGPTALDRIRVTLSGTQFDGDVDLNQCKVEGGTSFQIPTNARYTNIGTFEEWTNGSTATATINGYLSCASARAGDGALNTRGGTITGTGSLVVTGATIIYPDDGVVTNLLNVSGMALFSTGSLDVRAAAGFNFAGVSFSVEGNVTLNATSVISPSGGRILLNGAGAQVITCNGRLTSASGFDGFTQDKSAGSISYADAWTSSGDFLVRTAGANSTTFLAAANYGANSLDGNRSAPVGDTVYTSIDSSDGVTQFNFVVAGAGPTARNIDFKNMNLTGAIQQCATESCVNSGNNNLYPPTDGLEFVTAPTPLPTNGYGRYNTGGLGLGLGLATGGAYI